MMKLNIIKKYIILKLKKLNEKTFINTEEWYFFIMFFLITLYLLYSFEFTLYYYPDRVIYELNSLFELNTIPSDIPFSFENDYVSNEKGSIFLNFEFLKKGAVISTSSYAYLKYKKYIRHIQFIKMQKYKRRASKDAHNPILEPGSYNVKGSYRSRYIRKTYLLYTISKLNEIYVNTRVNLHKKLRKKYGSLIPFKDRIKRIIAKRKLYNDKLDFIKTKATYMNPYITLRKRNEMTYFKGFFYQLRRIAYIPRDIMRKMDLEYRKKNPPKIHRPVPSYAYYTNDKYNLAPTNFNRKIYNIYYKFAKTLYSKFFYNAIEPYRFASNLKEQARPTTHSYERNFFSAHMFLHRKEKFVKIYPEKDYPKKLPKNLKVFNKRAFFSEKYKSPIAYFYSQKKKRMDFTWFFLNCPTGFYYDKWYSMSYPYTGRLRSFKHRIRFTKFYDELFLLRNQHAESHYKDIDDGYHNLQRRMHVMYPYFNGNLKFNATVKSRNSFDVRDRATFWERFVCRYGYRKKDYLFKINKSKFKKYYFKINADFLGFSLSSRISNYIYILYENFFKLNNFFINKYIYRFTDLKRKSLMHKIRDLRMVNQYKKYWTIQYFPVSSLYYSFFKHKNLKNPIKTYKKRLDYEYKLLYNNFLFYRKALLKANIYNYINLLDKNKKYKRNYTIYNEKYNNLFLFKIIYNFLLFVFKPIFYVYLIIKSFYSYILNSIRYIYILIKKIIKQINFVLFYYEIKQNLLNLKNQLFLYLYKKKIYIYMEYIYTEVSKKSLNFKSYILKKLKNILLRKKNRIQKVNYLNTKIKKRLIKRLKLNQDIDFIENLKLLKLKNNKFKVKSKKKNKIFKFKLKGLKKIKNKKEIIKFNILKYINKKLNLILMKFLKKINNLQIIKFFKFYYYKLIDIYNKEKKKLHISKGKRKRMLKAKDKSFYILNNSKLDYRIRKIYRWRRLFTKYTWYDRLNLRMFVYKIKKNLLQLKIFSKNSKIFKDIIFFEKLYTTSNSFSYTMYIYLTNKYKYVRKISGININFDLLHHYRLMLLRFLLLLLICIIFVYIVINKWDFEDVSDNPLTKEWNLVLGFFVIYSFLVFQTNPDFIFYYVPTKA